MTTAQRAKRTEHQRGLLARPLDALVFLLPLLVFCEVVAISRAQQRVIAYEVFRGFFDLFGGVGRWAPSLGVVVILLATHAASHEKWNIHWRRVSFMYLESVGLMIPLFLLYWAIPLVGGTDTLLPALDRMAMRIGAGIYEELVFRLIVISVLVMIGSDLIRWDRSGVALAAVILSSVAFAAHHYVPIGQEPFNPATFGFRVMAGIYLAAIFWFRGYGLAAGTHAAYNVALVLWDNG